MKIEWETVVALLIAGVVLIALNGLFGKWIEEQGAKIHGTK